MKKERPYNLQTKSVYNYQALIADRLSLNISQVNSPNAAIGYTTFDSNRIISRNNKLNSNETLTGSFYISFFQAAGFSLEAFLTILPSSIYRFCPRIDEWSLYFSYQFIDNIGEYQSILEIAGSEISLSTLTGGTAHNLRLRHYGERVSKLRFNNQIFDQEDNLREYLESLPQGNATLLIPQGIEYQSIMEDIVTLKGWTVEYITE